MTSQKPELLRWLLRPPSVLVILISLTFSLLICTLRSDFEGGRKMLLQTRLFFLVGDPENKVGLYYKTTFFSGWRKVVLQTRIFFLVREKWLTRKKIRVCRTTFLEPLFYTFLEKWLQIKWLNVHLENVYLVLLYFSRQIYPFKTKIENSFVLLKSKERINSHLLLKKFRNLIV